MFFQYSLIGDVFINKYLCTVYVLRSLVALKGAFELYVFYLLETPVDFVYSTCITKHHSESAA